MRQDDAGSISVETWGADYADGLSGPQEPEWGEEFASTIEDGPDTIEFHPPADEALAEGVRVAIVDGTMRSEAVLSSRRGNHDVQGVAGSLAVGAVLLQAGQPARTMCTFSERVLVWGGLHGSLSDALSDNPLSGTPDDADLDWDWDGTRGVRWETDENGTPIPRNPEGFQRSPFSSNAGYTWRTVLDPGMSPAYPASSITSRMLSREGLLARRLLRENRADLVLTDGPLRISDRDMENGPAIMGYVKNHSKTYLAADLGRRVTAMPESHRSSLFVHDSYDKRRVSCYVKLKDAWGGDLLSEIVQPYGAIVRAEMPRTVLDVHGQEYAARLASLTTYFLSKFSSAAYRDARAPKNLTPVAGLESHLRRLHGDGRAAAVAVVQAVSSRKRRS